MMSPLEIPWPMKSLDFCIVFGRFMAHGSNGEAKRANITLPISVFPNPNANKPLLSDITILNK